VAGVPGRGRLTRARLAPVGDHRAISPAAAGRNPRWSLRWGRRAVWRGWAPGWLRHRLL